MPGGGDNAAVAAFAPQGEGFGSGRQGRELAAVTKEGITGKIEKRFENNPDMLYDSLETKSDDQKALDAYLRSIEIGELTPMADFSLYQAISREIDDVIVGTTTTNGIVVKSKSDHFIARVIGSVSERRSGVSTDGVILALTKPDRIDPVKINPETGQKSQRFIKKHVCAVTVNPETGNLIQTNPRE